MIGWLVQKFRNLVSKFRFLASGYSAIAEGPMVALAAWENGGPGGTRTPNQAVMSRRL